MIYQLLGISAGHTEYTQILRQIRTYFTARAAILNAGTDMTTLKHFLVASDFDQTLSFNDSGQILSDLLGVPDFQRKVEGLASSNLVQQGGELAYLIRHDPAFRGVRREHLVEPLGRGDLGGREVAAVGELRRVRAARRELDVGLPEDGLVAEDGARVIGERRVLVVDAELHLGHAVLRDVDLLDAADRVAGHADLVALDQLTGVLERRGLQRDIPRRPLELERPHDPVDRRIAVEHAAEAVFVTVGILVREVVAAAVAPLTMLANVRAAIPPMKSTKIATTRFGSHNSS